MSEQRDNSALGRLTARTQASIANDMRYAYEMGKEDAETLAETPNLRPEDMKGGSDLADDPFDPLRYAGEWHPASDVPPDEDWVLVYELDYGIEQHNLAFLKDGRWWKMFDDRQEPCNVQWWTSYPKPPQMDGGKA